MTQQPPMLQPLTPIQQLQAEKQRVTTQCDLQGKELNKDFQFIHENAASLLMSGLTDLLFAKRTNKANTPSQSEAVAAMPAEETSTASVGLSDYLSLIPGLVPVVWDITKPIITAWGIKKVQHWVIKLLFGKKKKKSNN